MLYGPHEWHMNQCNSDMLCNYVTDNEDRLIIHFLDYEQRPLARRVLLACHEKNLYPVGDRYQFWDECIFLNQGHREFHDSYVGPFRIIPNLKEEFPRLRKRPGAQSSAGVIGSIDRNKQTHVSILKALADGFQRIYLFGAVTEDDYYQEAVAPLIAANKKIVIECGYMSDKEAMYAMVGTVYLSSISEVAPLVKDECLSSGTRFIGSDACQAESYSMDNKSILGEWLNAISA